MQHIHVSYAGPQEGTASGAEANSFAGVLAAAPHLTTVCISSRSTVAYVLEEGLPWPHVIDHSLSWLKLLQNAEHLYTLWIDFPSTPSYTTQDGMVQAIKRYVTGYAGQGTCSGRVRSPSLKRICFGEYQAREWPSEFQEGMCRMLGIVL